MSQTAHPARTSAAHRLVQTLLINEIDTVFCVPGESYLAVLDALADLAHGQAIVGFTIPNIGKLVVVDRKARKGRNPMTGEAIDIPAKKVLKFRIAKAAKDAVAPPKK